MSATVPCCANCKCTEVSTKSSLRARSDVKVRDVLSMIFGYSFTFEDSQDDDWLVLCKNCDEILFLLHHLYHHFSDLRKSGSTIDILKKQIRKNKSASEDAAMFDNGEVERTWETPYEQEEDENESDDVDPLGDRSAANTISLGTLIPAAETKPQIDPENDPEDLCDSDIPSESSEEDWEPGSEMSPFLIKSFHGSSGRRVVRQAAAGTRQLSTRSKNGKRPVLTSPTSRNPDLRNQSTPLSSKRRKFHEASILRNKSPFDSGEQKQLKTTKNGSSRYVCECVFMSALSEEKLDVCMMCHAGSIAVVLLKFLSRMTDLTPSCANCKYSEVHSKSTLRTRSDVKVRDVLSSIFGYSFPFEDSEDDDVLVLCKNCDEILFLLHHLYHHFGDIRKSGSTIANALKNQFVKAKAKPSNSFAVTPNLNPTDTVERYEEEQQTDEFPPIDDTLPSNVSMGTLIPAVEIKTESDDDVVDLCDTSSDVGQNVLWELARPANVRQNATRRNAKKTGTNTRQPRSSSTRIRNIGSIELRGKRTRSSSTTVTPRNGKWKNPKRTTSSSKKLKASETSLYQNGNGEFGPPSSPLGSPLLTTHRINGHESCPTRTNTGTKSLKRSNALVNDVKVNGEERDKIPLTGGVMTQDELPSARRKKKGKKSYLSNAAKQKRCQDCGNIYKNYNVYIQHLKTIHNRRLPYGCANCSEEFRTRDRLWSHSAAVHGGSPMKNFKCTHPGCEKSFVFGGDLKTHAYMHDLKRRREEKQNETLMFTPY